MPDGRKYMNINAMVHLKRKVMGRNNIKTYDEDLLIENELNLQYSLDTSC